MKIKNCLVIFLIVNNISLFSMQSSLVDSLRAFKNKSEELLDVLKPKGGGTARPLPKDKKQQSKVEDVSGSFVDNSILPVKFDIKDQKLKGLLKDINEFYQPIKLNILIFLRNLAIFKRFLKKNQGKKFTERPREFQDLVDFPLFDTDLIENLSSKINELTQYGKDNSATISSDEKLSIKKYLQSNISKTLENLYFTVWGDVDFTSRSMQSIMWPDDYPGVGRQEGTAFDWFRIKVENPLVHQTASRSALQGQGCSRSRPVCAADQLNCSILDDAISAFK